MATLTVARRRPGKSLIYAALVIIAGVLATTLAQPQVLARLPLQNLLKNEFHLDRTANAAFFFWAGLAWYLKPFAGILTDAFPLFGSRRKSYIVISASLAALSWLALTVTPHEFRDLLLVGILINAFMVIASTAVGGYMVETAQATSGSGRLTAIRQFVQQASLVINGPAAGYLAGIAFAWTAAACGGILFFAGAGHHPVFTGTAATTGFAPNFGKRPRPARQYRHRPDDVGSGRSDGVVLHRAGLCDGTFLQAAERASPRYARPGLFAIDRRCLRRAGSSRLRRPVPPP